MRERGVCMHVCVYKRDTEAEKEIENVGMCMQSEIKAFYLGVKGKQERMELSFPFPPETPLCLHPSSSGTD